jgi:Flp pilus assembly protein TadG
MAAGVLRKAFSALRADERGGIGILMALSAPVLLGMAMLAIDGGRYMNLHTSMQNGADALALVAAAELDGQSDAITRANRALANVTANDPRFGTSGARITAASVRYLPSLPTSDATAIPTANVTTDPTKAAYVEIVVNAVGFSSIFSKAAHAVGGPTQAQATAVAGFDSAACNIAPLFMCNPMEESTTSIFTAARESTFKRRLMSVRAKGTSVGPGNYGFLEPAYGTGGAAVKASLAIDEPKGCYPKSGVELQTGNIASAAEAMNVRFDMYDGSWSTSKGDPSYRPARNVRKGYTGPACNRSVAYTPTKPPTDAANVGKPLGLPRDSCFYTNTCSYGGTAVDGRIGEGDWDFETYWKRTYNNTNYPNPSGTQWSNSNRPSRYEVYRYEIDNNLVATATADPAVTTANQETGAPMCYTGGSTTLTDDPDRRTFVGALINCEAAIAAGQMSGSSGGRIPVVAYAKFFMTEPMDKNDGTIWAEMVELVEPGTLTARNYIRDSVQLYR